MTTASVTEFEIPQATKITITEDTLSVDLEDGRTVAVPTGWYPRLAHGTPEEWADYEIGPVGIHWEHLDEDISIRALLLGRKSGESAKSLQRWLDQRNQIKDDMDNEPDFVQGRVGEHGDFLDEESLKHFFIDNRRFDVRIEEQANGVWHASTELVEGAHGVLFHLDYAPAGVTLENSYGKSREGATPRDAFEALESVIRVADDDRKAKQAVKKGNR